MIFMSRGVSNTRQQWKPKVTAETPLTVKEEIFIDEYLKDGDKQRAAEKVNCKSATAILNKPNVMAEIIRRQEEMCKKSIADGSEVMRYLTSVMRGEVSDQFGLDAPLAERTRAATEIAKRTIDLENKIRETETTPININLNWKR